MHILYIHIHEMIYKNKTYEASVELLGPSLRFDGLNMNAFRETLEALQAFVEKNLKNGRMNNKQAFKISL